MQNKIFEYNGVVLLLHRSAVTTFRMCTVLYQTIDHILEMECRNRLPNRMNTWKLLLSDCNVQNCYLKKTKDLITIDWASYY